jgi:hypothetical protein
VGGAAVEHLLDEPGGGDGLPLALELGVQLVARAVVDEQHATERRIDLRRDGVGVEPE